MTTDVALPSTTGPVDRPAAAPPGLLTSSRHPFCALDEASFVLSSTSEPWSVHLEVGLEGTVAADRLRRAVALALTRHPRARGRTVTTGRRGTGFEWEIAPTPDVDPVEVVVCGDDDALQAARTDLQSLAVPLHVSPPVRVRLARHPGGDVVMLNVHHAAGDGIAALGLLRSIARAYAARPDPVTGCITSCWTLRTRQPSPAGQLLPEPPSTTCYWLVCTLPCSAGSANTAARRNFSFMVPVVTRPADRRNPTTVVSTIRRRTQHIKHERTPAVVVGLLDVLQHLPLSAKRSIARLAASERVIPTAILSNLGRLDDSLDFGPKLRTSEVWFSPPVKMPMGVAVGAVTARGRLHLVFRYRYPLFGPAQATGFADRYLAALALITG